jgi:hypothetical protein
MSKPHPGTTTENNDHQSVGPGSSHQGGSHGHTRASKDESNSHTTREPGTPTNSD